MIDGSKNRKRQLVFELQSSCVYEKCSKVLFVCLLYNRTQLTRKRSKAVGCGERQMYKKIKILQKLTYLSAKGGFFYSFSSTSRHGPLISQKNFAN